MHGHLRLLKSKFGTGFLMDGTHPAISTGPARMERSVFHITRGQPGALVYENTVARQPKLVNLTNKVLPLSFLECEELGVNNPKQCGSCNNCCVCSTQGVEMSRKDRAELTLIQEGMTLWHYRSLRKRVRSLSITLSSRIFIN